MTNHARALGLGWILALCLVGGCGQRFRIEAPRDFVELDPATQSSRGYALRATTADGVVLAVREIDNDRHGSRDFWVSAIRNRLRRAGGYALLEETDVRLASGDAARQLRFGRDEGSRPYAYWLTVVVRRDRIVLIEAGGRREVFDAHRDEIERAIRDTRVL